MKASMKKRKDGNTGRIYRPSKLAKALSDACQTDEPAEGFVEKQSGVAASKQALQNAPLTRIRAEGFAPHVLVVDDDSGVRRSLARVLTREGCSPITTGDGHAVVDLCTRMRPALIFLDISMPNFNGPQVLKALKASMGEDYPPVVWITGSITPENLKTMGGAVACIPKPLDVSKIRHIIKRYLIGG
jgi:CheY-like chemotaxis protein